jgi:hypothetical protein
MRAFSQKTIVTAYFAEREKIAVAKYYIKSGSLEIIYSCNKPSFEAAQDAVWELNDNDTLDEFFYVDERGYRDYTTADKETRVFNTQSVMESAGWNMEDL